jgi:HlyD family secretion protein
MKKKKKIIISVILTVVIVIVFICFITKNRNKNFVSKTEKAEYGDICDVITATGTLNPIITVDVGTQVSGIIDKIYVDFNSKVRQGQVIARLDTNFLAASLLDAKANLEKSKSKLDYDEKNYKRIKQLYESKIVAETDYETALYNYETAKANYQSAKAQIERAKINLKYATIKSPISGVITSRNVDEGQTVAASFNTPTLFTIAKDLTKMQVEADVDEADIGQVRNGQRVEFSVDAFIDEIFQGTVIQIRLKPEVIQNVVTYTVIIEAPNPELKLMPGMTANITVYVKELKNVLKISLQALNFEPLEEFMADYEKNIPDSVKNRHKKRIENSDNNSSEQTKNKKNSDIFENVWIKQGDNIRPQRVKTGLNNGVFVEIKKGIKQGTEIIIAQEIQKKENENNKKSPFMPSRRKKKK